MDITTGAATELATTAPVVVAPVASASDAESNGLPQEILDEALCTFGCSPRLYAHLRTGYYELSSNPDPMPGSTNHLPLLLSWIDRDGNKPKEGPGEASEGQGPASLDMGRRSNGKDPIVYSDFGGGFCFKYSPQLMVEWLPSGINELTQDFKTTDMELDGHDDYTQQRREQMIALMKEAFWKWRIRKYDYVIEVASKHRFKIGLKRTDDDAQDELEIRDLTTGELVARLADLSQMLWIENGLLVSRTLFFQVCRVQWKFTASG
ncbi:uncharacterized protein BJ171DRAFT_518114 [Polychytrium aggregatum]|uniref:uncharacterized protein n=1 Tax=Polychytrium aggregatum TaxID=110093 RepID=UPI0022FDEC5B|nr:uncharacterized protein BJ171DRAFT_518114 [Polychytrium aggregatum]KAI9199632.1 hypothetical protein BJ171DRAFT_518114 [Polychytrium aggregatum]